MGRRMWTSPVQSIDIVDYVPGLGNVNYSRTMSVAMFEKLCGTDTHSTLP